MQLIIKHKLNKELVLPISYHHILQGIIYNGLKSDIKYSTIIHSSNNETYKPFCFSEITGKYRIEDKNIIFIDSIQWEIRSIDIYLIKTLYDSFTKKGISYNYQTFENSEIKIKEDTIEAESLKIRMLTPIVIYETIDKHRYYLNPFDDKYNTSILSNFAKKYKKYCNIDVDITSLSFEVVSLSKTDKVVTKFKDTYITGYKGIYKIYGSRKYLDFLYQCGLGSLNSQGFGLFELVE